MTVGFTHHGGRLAAACAHFGGDRTDWLDLSTGINPNGWTPPGDLAVNWHDLPDPDALARLEAAAARHFGCDPALCIAVPGSETALRLLARLLDLPGVHRPPCYGTYRAAFAESEPWADLDALPARASVLVLGNPNNPDGAMPNRRTLLAALAHQEGCGGWLILDEAFADCDPRATLADLVARGRRLIVLRSFGKFFGLAGLRLGFVIAPPAVMRDLRGLLGDWPLHSAALAFGTAAYDDGPWIERARRMLADQAAELDALLVRRGVDSRGTCPLFRLIVTSDAAGLFERLAHRHILIRPFAEHHEYMRIGLPGDRSALDRLEQALD